MCVCIYICRLRGLKLSASELSFYALEFVRSGLTRGFKLQGLPCIYIYIYVYYVYIYIYREREMSVIIITISSSSSSSRSISSYICYS